MKTVNSIALTAACILSANVLAADTPRIYNRSFEVDTRYYAVACPNGEMASASVRFDVKEADTKPVSDEASRLRAGNPKPNIPNIIEVCAYPVSGTDKKCSASMDLQKAAKEACN
ncbi:MAG: hypothetical protein RLT87_04220 [Gammaproteobacteria bacterium]